MQRPEVWPGRPFPLGASWDGEGTNFSLFSEAAEKVELCLFDEDGEETRVPLEEVDAYCWHAYLPGIRSGQRSASPRMKASVRASASWSVNCSGGLFM